MQGSFQGGLNLEQGWPLRDLDLDRIIIHLHDLDPNLLKDGDSYFCLTRGYYQNLQLVLRHMIGGSIREYPVLESDYHKLFAMDWLSNISAHDASDLAILLDHCLLAAEEGISAMTLDKVRLAVRSYHDNQDEDGLLPHSVDFTGGASHTFSSIKTAFAKSQQQKLGKVIY